MVGTFVVVTTQQVVWRRFFIYYVKLFINQFNQNPKIMKKLFALALVVLGLAACQTEPEGLDVNVGGEVETLINVSVPESATRAAAGTNSAEGVFKNGVLASDDYTMRYILQIYTADGNPSNERLVAYSDDKSVVFPVRLIAGRDYKYVVWADVVESEDDTDLHYNTADLKNITLNDTWKAMDETRDAFTASVDVEDYSKSSSLNITLYRPFAKLRIVTTDIQAVRNLNVEPKTATVTYTTAYREAFNAYESKANAAGSSKKEHKSYEIKSYGETGADFTLFTDYFFAEQDVVKFDFAAYDQNGDLIAEESFGTDIPVERNYLTTLKGSILTDASNVTVTVSDPFAIPENEYNANDIKSAFDLQKAINEAQDGVNTVITLGVNIDSDDTSLFPIVVPENKVITLNLNGKSIAGTVANPKEGIIWNKGTLTVTEGTITSKATNGCPAILNNGTLTLTDATIQGAPSDTSTGYASYAVNNDGVGSKLTANNTNISGRGAIGATNGAKVEINGGTYHTPEVASGHAIYAVNEGTEVVINDGTFSEGYAYSGDNWGMYQIYSGDKAKVTVNGGNFEAWDCANGYDLCTANDGVIEIYGGYFAEDPTNQNGKNYAATGYISIKISDEKYTVMKGIVDNGVNTYIIENADDLKHIAEIVDAGATLKDEVVRLDADIILPEENWNPIGDNRTDMAFSGTFDGQDHLISGAKISGDFCWDGSVYGSKEGWGLFSVLDGATVKNVKLDNEVFASYTVISGGVAGYAQDTTFENIEISNTQISGYNWYTGGVVGWASGNCTFKGIKLNDTVSVGTLWDSHGQCAGGIAGGISSSGTYVIEDCEIACVMDVINDVTSNYKWWIYRVSGMIIGNVSETKEFDGRNYAYPTNLTCNNVTVTYGDWMNYHYCQGYWNRGWGRVESSEYVSGIDHTQCNHPAGEQHYVCVPFDQIFGGGPNTNGRTPVYGLREFAGVTVNYPKSYQPVKDKAALMEAISNGGTAVLLSDIDMGTEQLAVTSIVDLNGCTLTTNMTYGGISVKNGGSIKNGTIEHKSTVAAIKAFDVEAIENVTIKTTCATANKIVTAIAVQQGGKVGSIKNVTIEGVSQGIEVGYQATVGTIEDVTVSMNANGTAEGIGLVINGGKVGKATNCVFEGDNYGVKMQLKGVFDVALELAGCTATGATASIAAYDEKGISNTSGSLTLTYDAATTLNGPFVWDFEDECKSVVTLNKPN